MFANEPPSGDDAFKLPKVTANFEDGKQVIKSSGSVGANYGSNDLIKAINKENDYLIDEAEQLQRILSTIINKLT